MEPEVTKPEIHIRVSPGELIDRITILQIRAEHVVEPGKIQRLLQQLDRLTQARDQAIPSSPTIDQLAERLKQVNGELWQIEDDIRRHERRGDFGEAFVQLARSVYKKNDTRSRIKQQINRLLDSQIEEEKLHPAY